MFVYFNEPKLGLPFTSSDKDKKTQKMRKLSLVRKDSENNPHGRVDNKKNKSTEEQTEEGIDEKKNE